MDLLFEFKKQLEFCLSGNASITIDHYRLKTALINLQNRPNNSKAVKIICDVCQNLIDNSSEDKIIEILDLLDNVDRELIKYTGTISTQEILDIEVMETEYIQISNNILKDFNAVVYMNCEDRINIFKQVLKDKSILKDFRILRGLVYALNDNYDEIREESFNNLMTLDKSYVGYLENEIENMQVEKFQSKEKLAEIIDIICKS